MEATKDISQSIAEFYNIQRLHSIANKLRKEVAVKEPIEVGENT